MTFGVFMPVGPGQKEALRAADTLESVAAHNEKLRWVVLVDDSIEERNLAETCHMPESCTVTVLQNPRKGKGLPEFGGLCIALLVALDLLQRTDASFVVKLDTDSLVIRPFEKQVERELRQHPDTGLLGVIGDSFGENRTYALVDTNRFWMEQVLAMPSTYDEFKRNGPPGWLGTPDETWYQCFLQARRVLVRAVGHGYELGKFCWGGCFVLSRPLLNALVASDAFREPLIWRDLALGDDMMISIYCAALGLKMYDVSQHGPHFAVQWGTLPFSRQELARSKYSVLHSIKGSCEDDFRTFFRERRSRTVARLRAKPGNTGKSTQPHDFPQPVGVA